MAYYTTGTSLTPRYCPILEFRDVGPGEVLPVARTLPPGASGYDPDFDFYPKSLTLVSKHKALPNIFSVKGTLVCDGAFLDVLESFESGVHQTRPVQIFRKDGKLINGRYYYFNIVSRIAGIILENSDLRPMFDADFPNGVLYFFKGPENKRVLNKLNVNGLCIWRDKIVRGYIYVSNEFHKIYNEMKFNGFEDFYFAEEI